LVIPSTENVSACQKNVHSFQKMNVKMLMY
jgi:hypothetical protein